MAKLTRVIESVLQESMVDDAAALVGIEKDEAAERIEGLSFANYLELGNAVDMEDVETAREILGTVSAIEEDLNEGGADFGLLTPEEMQGLPTPRLLAYYKAKRKEHKQNNVGSDWDVGAEYLDEVGKTIAIAKKILDTREHLGEDIFDEEKLLDKPTPSLKDLAKKHDMLTSLAAEPKARYWRAAC